MFGPKPNWYSNHQSQTPYSHHPYSHHPSMKRRQHYMGEKRPSSFFQYHSRPQSQMMQGIPPHWNQKAPSRLKAAFTSEDGKFDVGKTVQTVDQVIKTVNQVSPLVKQVSSFFIKK